MQKGHIQLGVTFCQADWNNANQPKVEKLDKLGKI
jgi:hypothetical protein